MPTDTLPAVRASDLAFDLREPCNDCPFRRSTPPHEGVASGLIGVLHSIDEGTFAHSCHKTDTRPGCDGPVAGKETGRPIQFCVGALLMMLKHPTKWMQATIVEAFDTKFPAKEMIDRANSHTDIVTLPELVRTYADFAQEKVRELSVHP